MKKILVSAAFLSIAALVSTKAWAMAEPPGAATGEATSDGADESASDAADDELAPDVAARCRRHHAAFDGLYLGGGVHIANVGEKSEYLGGAPSGYKHDLQSNDSKTRLGGSFLIGYGQKIPESPAYLGFEAGLDIAPNTDNVHASKTEPSIWGAFPGGVAAGARMYDLETRRSGFAPYVTTIAGVYYCGRLFFIKFGASYAKSTEKYTASGNTFAPAGAWIYCSSENKVSTITPLVALGMRKPCGKGMSYRIEIEYKFGKSKEKNIDYLPNIPAGLGAFPFVSESKTKLTQKGAITFRWMICFNASL